MECKCAWIEKQQKESNLELIETLWNVNDEESVEVIEEISRINRNIVECKLERSVDGWYSRMEN